MSLSHLLKYVWSGIVAPVWTPDPGSGTKHYQSMIEGHLCEEFLVSVASPRYLEDGYAQQFKLFCTPSCTAVNLYFRFCNYFAIYVHKKHFYDGTKPLLASSFVRLEQTHVGFISTKRVKTTNVKCQLQTDLRSTAAYISVM